MVATNARPRAALDAYRKRWAIECMFGDAKTRGGAAVSEEVTEGLVREDGKYLYPVRDDIPIMLIDEAIPLEG